MQRLTWLVLIVILVAADAIAQQCANSALTLTCPSSIGAE